MKSFRNYGKIVKNVIHQMFFRGSNPNEVGRNHNHLEDQYRRKILSPDAAHKHIFEMLRKDEHFLNMLEFSTGHHIVRVAIIGEELRANIHDLARFPCGLMTPAFDAGWRKSDVLSYALHEDDGQYHFVLVASEADVDNTLTFDSFEPTHCYARPLTRDEIQTINVYSRPSWKKIS